MDYKQLSDFPSTGNVLASDLIYAQNVNTGNEQKTTVQQLQNFLLGGLAPQRQSIPVTSAGESSYGTVGYTVGLVNVFIAGLRLNPSQYQALDGINIVIIDAKVIATLVPGMTIDLEATLTLAAQNAATPASVLAMDPVNQPAVGTLTGTEITSIRQGAGLFQASLTKIAQWVASTYQGFTQNFGGIARTLLAKLLDSAVSIEDFGAVGDGVTDDHTAINTALSSGASVLKGSTNKTYRCSAGILVPPNVILMSDGVTPGVNPDGFTLLFDLAVATCVTVGGTVAHNASESLRNVNVVRAGISQSVLPPAGSIGVLVQNASNVPLVDVNVVGHSVAYEFLTDGATAGISAQMTRCFSSAITDAHVVVNGWPELRASQCRFGSNTSSDYSANCYVRITGGSATNAGAGPNTVVFDNSQFALGNGATVSRVIEFVNQLTGSVSTTDQYIFTGGSRLTSYLNFVYSDASWPLVKSLTVSSSSLNAAVEFFATNAGTGLTDCCVIASNVAGPMTFPANQIRNFRLIGNNLGSTVSTAASTLLSNLIAVGNRIAGLTTLGGANGGTGTVEGNTYNAGLTVSGVWTNLSVSGVLTSGTYSNTATGKWAVSIPGLPPLNWTPILSLNGSTAGFVYTTQLGHYEVVGNEVIATFDIVLGAAGAALGNLEITGLPIASTSIDQSAFAGGGAASYVAAMTGLTGGVTLRMTAGASQADVFQAGATGMARVTNANLTATTALAGTIRYFR